MCGITGMLGFSDKALLRRMTNALEHRGPNDSGYYTDKYAGLGNRRLSIIDLKRGRQPVHNEDRSVWITFNGEIYNFKALRASLSNHKFYTNTDTEAIVHCYEEFSESFVEKLHGMFAFALWDSGEKKLVLARDRLGIKPLYYALADGKLVFASEVKSLVQYDGIERKLNAQALWDYMTFRYVPGRATAIEGVYRLEPGHVLVCRVKNNKVTAEKRKYWDMSFATGGESEASYAKKVSAALEEAVASHMVSDVPIGAYLSGGLDSSAVIAHMARHSEAPVNTFTVGFGEADDELPYARTVAEAFGTNHKEIMVRVKDAAKNFPKIVWHLDEPVADPAAIPTYFMSLVTKKHVTVLLTGEGADEQFAGYGRYTLMAKRMLPAKKMIYKKLVSTFPDSAKRNALQHFATDARTADISFIKSEMPAYRFEMSEWLPNDLLLKVDRMTMAHSLEARVPFLDHKLVEMSLSIPMALKIRGSMKKYILRKALEGVLPRSILQREKHSFSVPLGRWFEKEDMAGKLRGSEIFSSSYVEKIKDRKPRQLYSMLVFDTWHRLYIRGEKP